MKAHAHRPDLRLAFDSAWSCASFPFAAFRALRFRGGVACPHCEGTSIQRWGGFSGRRRYRCNVCRRTFSDFTGTPLAYLKRVEDWPGFCRCVVYTLSIRESAQTLQMNPATAFRWRHRLLAALNAGDMRTGFAGSVVISETSFPYAEKGKRPPVTRPTRPARPDSAVPARAWIVTARDLQGTTCTTVSGLRHPTAADIIRTLGARLAGATVGATGRGQRAPPVVLCPAGPFSPAATAARRLALRHMRIHRQAPEVTELRHFVLRLRRWLRRFRGVATRYLDHYMAWHRLDEPRSPRELFALLLAWSAQAENATT